MKKSEHGEQVAVIDFCNANHKKYPALKWIFAVPNGAKLGGDKRLRGIQMNMLKAEGFKPGVPDLFLPCPMISHVDDFGYDGFHGLFIEMKCRDTKGRVSKEQKEWHEYLMGQGYKVEVCWDADEAIKAIMDYIV